MRVRAPAVAAVFTVLMSACGGSGGAPGSGTPSLTVLAASSLANAFPEIGRAYSREQPGRSVRFSFAGTDTLVAQIEQGAPADVFAGASVTYGARLAAEGLIDDPVAFCTNRLVLVLSPDNPAGIHTLRDLAKEGVRLVVGAETVPAGFYTRTVLANLDATYGSGYSDRVLDNVVSSEQSVEAVLTKVRLGEADAGFVYATDGRAAGADVRVIGLPEDAQATVAYPIGAVTASRNHAEAQRFVEFVLGPEGQRILRVAGFGRPPSTS